MEKCTCLGVFGVSIDRHDGGRKADVAALGPVFSGPVFSCICGSLRDFNI